MLAILADAYEAHEAAEAARYPVPFSPARFLNCSVVVPLNSSSQGPRRSSASGSLPARSTSVSSLRTLTQSLSSSFENLLSRKTTSSKQSPPRKVTLPDSASPPQQRVSTASSFTIKEKENKKERKTGKLGKYSLHQPLNGGTFLFFLFISVVHRQSRLGHRRTGSQDRRGWRQALFQSVAASQPRSATPGRPMLLTRRASVRAHPLPVCPICVAFNSSPQTKKKINKTPGGCSRDLNHARETHFPIFN